MADEEGAGASDPVKCPECKPGLPTWMATFSDMVTLLLTFFILLLSFAKMETHKYQAALGSIRNAFKGNILKKGEVVQQGKSPDDAPTMLESEAPARPFPIEFLTTEGILEKYEINRESEEDLDKMRNDLYEYSLDNAVTIYQIPEGIKVRIKDKIYFKEGRVELNSITIEVFERLVKMLSAKDWTVFVEGHAGKGEVSSNRKMDAFALSSARAAVVARSLVKRGVRPDKITTVFYGDTRPEKGLKRKSKIFKNLNRRVEFLLRKVDLRTEGQKVDSR